MGVRGSDGRVLVPTAEFDLVTYEQLTEIVPVSSVGTVLSWTWQQTPLEGQPLDEPFAWALIKLDSADTALLHAVKVASSADIRTGDRVRAHWIDERQGAITDIAYFEPGETPEPAAEADDRDPVTMIETPVAIEIQHTASVQRAPTCAPCGMASFSADVPAKPARCISLRAKSIPPPARRWTTSSNWPTRDGHDVRDHQHPVRGAADQAPMSPPTCCSTEPTFRFFI